MKQHIVVDVRSALHLVAGIIRWLSLAYLLPLAAALFYGESVLPFVVPMLLAIVLGWLGERLTRSASGLGVREGFLVVGVAWLAIAAFGALPYALAQHSLIDAYFEAMSGFTTTGATILTDIESEPRSLLIWRQFTQWLGGMGIIVLAIAVLPKLSVGGRQLMEAEAPGPTVDKLTPHIYQTARALWKIYLGLTLIQFLLLKLLGLSFYDSLAHAFTTMSTGGFSPRTQSMAAFGPAVQWVVILFMVLAGTNFALMYRVLLGRVNVLWKDHEFRFYVGLILSAGIVIALLLSDLSLEERLRHGWFQAASIITTTGYASVDFEEWNNTLKMVLLTLMFFGGCAGSTGGSIKMVRSLLVFRFLARELRKIIHPQAVIPVRLGNRVISEGALNGIMAFAILYITTFAVGSVLLLLDAQRAGIPMTVIEGVGVAAATLGNVGPAFGLAGPMSSYAGFPETSKILMIFLMWAGRLELFPVLVLLTREYWKR